MTGPLPLLVTVDSASAWSAAPAGFAALALVVLLGWAYRAAGRSGDAFQRQLERAVVLPPVAVMAASGMGASVVEALDRASDIEAARTLAIEQRAAMLRARTEHAIQLVERLAPHVAVDLPAEREVVRSALLGAQIAHDPGDVFVLTRGGVLRSRRYGSAMPEAERALRSMVALAFREAVSSGDGVYVSWQSVETDGPVQTVAFVADAPRWGWAVGSSARVDDIRREHAAAVRSLRRSEAGWLALIVLGTAGALLLAWLLGKRLAERLAEATRAFGRRLERAISNRAPFEGAPSPCCELERAGRAVNVLLEAEWKRVADLDQARTDLAEANRELLVANARAVELASRAERANQVKSDFLARASHGLRTPLHAVLGHLELIGAETDQPSVRALSVAARDNATWLQSIVDDLIELSEGEDASKRVRWSWFDPAESVTSTVDTYREVARSAGLALELEVGPNVPRLVWAHARSFARITDLLLANAMNWTREGRVRVRLSSECTELQLEVRDDGPGLTARQQASAFELFGPPDATSAQPGRGSRPRLAVAQRLAGELRGRLEVESQVGIGTNLRFAASFEAVPAGAERLGDGEVTSGDRDRSPPRVDPEPVSGSGEARVLVVDDVLVNRRLASAMLARSGVRARVAEDGWRAIELMNDSTYDLVLMDCQMPGLDGYATTRAIRDGRGGDQHRDVPIVALTASGTIDDEERCLDAGMNGHVAKPFTASQIADVVVRFSRRSRPEPAAAAGGAAVNHRCVPEPDPSAL